MKFCPFDGKKMQKVTRLIFISGQYQKVPGQKDDANEKHVEYVCEECDASLNEFNGIWLLFNGAGTFVKVTVG